MIFAYGGSIQPSTVFQLAYTSVFGFHAAFLFLRTGSVLPPILSHIFCNIMGFPHPAEAVHRRPAQKYGVSKQLLGKWRQIRR